MERGDIPSPWWATTAYHNAKYGTALSQMTATSNVNSLSLLEEGDGNVLVKPANQDWFMLSATQAVQACGMYDTHVRNRMEQATELHELLKRWLIDNRERIKSAHLSVRNGDFLFVVMQKTVEYDQALSEALTDLDIEIANDPSFDKLQVDVLALPSVSPEAATAFLGGS